MNAQMPRRDGSTVEIPIGEVGQHLHNGEFFWLDLDGVDAEATKLLCEGFGFHPLAVEDAEHFGQRPKIEDYDGFTYFVIHGADADAPSNTVEVHIFYSEEHVVTVHHGSGAGLDQVRERIGRHRATELTPPQVSIVYLVVDNLVDSFFPVLSKFDDRIDELEDEILKTPTEEQLAELFDMKRTLVSLRKVVTPQRDMFA